MSSFSRRSLRFSLICQAFFEKYCLYMSPCDEIKTLNHHHKWLSVLCANLMTLLIEGAYQSPCRAFLCSFSMWLLFGAITILSVQPILFFGQSGIFLAQLGKVRELVTDARRFQRPRRRFKENDFALTSAQILFLVTGFLYSLITVYFSVSCFPSCCFTNL